MGRVSFAQTTEIPVTQQRSNADAVNNHIIMRYLLKKETDSSEGILIRIGIVRCRIRMEICGTAAATKGIIEYIRAVLYAELQRAAVMKGKERIKYSTTNRRYGCRINF